MKAVRLAMRTAPLLRATARFSVTATPLPGALRSLADYDPAEYGGMIIQLDCMRSEEQVLRAFEVWGGALNEEALCVLTDAILDHEIVLGPRFRDVCAPIIAHYLALMGRDSSYSFGYIVQNLAAMGVSSEALWGVVFAKFEKEAMEQYVPVVLLSRLFMRLLEWRAPPAPLLRRIFGQLTKFGARLPAEELADLRRALSDREEQLAPLLGTAEQASLQAF